MHIHGCKQTPPTPPTTSDEESSGNTSDDEMKKKKGNRAMGKKKYPKAIKYYTKAINVAPDNPTYHLNRCIANAALELWKDAERDAGTAVDLGNPAPAKGHWQFARARFQRGRCQEAKEAVTAGLAAYPDDKALVQLSREIDRGIAQREAKERRRQEEEAAKRNVVGPTGALALLTQARESYSAGRAEETLRLCADARNLAREAASAAVHGSEAAEKARRDEISILSLAGKAAMQLRKWPEAVESFEAVVQLEEAVYKFEIKEEREALSNAYNNLGICLKNAGKMEDAVRALKKAYHNATAGDDKVATPQCAQILQNLAQALRAQKKDGEARLIYERCLEQGKQLFGPEHASQAINHVGVARCLRAEGNILEAIKAYLRAVDLWSSKDIETCLQEMPEMPNKDRLAQVQQQVRTELAQLVAIADKLKEAGAGGAGADADASGAAGASASASADGVGGKGYPAAK